MFCCLCLVHLTENQNHIQRHRWRNQKWIKENKKNFRIRILVAADYCPDKLLPISEVKKFMEKRTKTEDSVIKVFFFFLRKNMANY